jgi:FkbM family methyltransferase
VGSWSIGLSKIFNKVIAFEPQPTNNQYLHSNIANAGAKNILAHQLAITNDVRKQFTITANNTTRNSGMAHLVPLNASNDNSPVVRCARLDDILENTLETGNSIDALKIDVEGLELDVLKSGKLIINEHKPTILLEINGNCLRYGTTSEEVYDHMNDLKYKNVHSTRNDNVFIPK